MKVSIRAALSLFTLFERILIIVELICRKLRFPPVNKLLFAEFTEYTNVIESGLSLKKWNKNLFLSSYTINDKTIKIFIRRGSSDLQVVKTVIIEEEYGAVTRQINSNKNITIIDAGANIGATTIFFKVHYPDSLIISVEPDASNLEIFKLNMSINNISSVIPIQAALWNNETKLSLRNSFRDGLEWSRSVTELKDGEVNYVNGITVDSLIRDFKLNKIDLFKIDIEGSEAVLFKDSKFLQVINSIVHYLIIEIHEEVNIKESIENNLNSRFELKDSSSVNFYSNVST